MSSHRSNPGRARGRLRVGGAVAAVVLTATGCGSTNDNGSDATSNGDNLSAAQQKCVDAANTYLDDHGLLPETLPEELKPLSKPPTPGLVFTKLMIGAVPTDVQSSKLMADYASEIGWVGKTLAFDGSVEDANRKLMDAIATSDVVAVVGQDPATLQGPIQAAKDKGVLLLMNAAGEPASVPGWGGIPI